MQYHEQKANVEYRLKKLSSEMDRLYSLTKETLGDFNATLVAKSVRCVSGILTSATISTPVYYVLSLLFGMGLSVALIILIEIYRRKFKNGEFSGEYYN